MVRAQEAAIDKKLMGVGATGTIVAAVCCFTPALVIGLSAVGLSAWLAGLDYVLLPALAAFVCLTVFAMLRRSGGSGDS